MAAPAEGRPPELRDGQLACTQGHQFPVTAFVPDLRPPESSRQAATVRHYSALWNVHVRGLSAASSVGPQHPTTTPYGNVSADTAVPHVDKASAVPESALGTSHAAAVARTAPLDAHDGDVCLDAGCGDGIDLLWLASRAREADYVGLDLSEGAYLTQRRVAHLPNVHVVRGSVLAPPFQPACFDLLYSYGVLHHTPNPPAAFARLAACVRDGGRTFLYVYSDLQETPLLRLALWPVNQLRAWSARQPPRVLHWLALGGSPFVFSTFGLAAGALRAAHRPDAADRLPFNWVRSPLGAYGDLFDRFGAQYEFRHNRRELNAWFAASGHRNVQVAQIADRRGWLAWGTKPPR